MWRYFLFSVLGLSLTEFLNPREKYECLFCQPEQIHIAFGEKPNEIIVMWSTQDPKKLDSIVHYGVGQLDLKTRGVSWNFTTGPRNSRQVQHSQWIHRVLLKDLKYNTTYSYNVGSNYSWSERLSFRTLPEGQDWVVSAAIYGDLGLANAHSLPYLQDEVDRGHYQFIVHVGDLAYDLNTNNATVGDQFMRQIQPIAAAVPYMVCPGNHEAAFNFSNYKNRFSMPGGHDSMYGSWDAGPVHFIGFSTELYYGNDNSSTWLEALKQQLRWIRQDLTEANRTENRRKRPWIIMFGHRPMYCSSQKNECPLPDVPQRAGAGLPEPGLGIEPLLKEFGVDLIIFGHEHSYERMLPLYNHTIYNGTGGNPYVNPQAPVHLVTGSAGCREGTYEIDKNKPWTVFSSTDYGYTKFKAFNKSHLYLEQVGIKDVARTLFRGAGKRKLMKCILQKRLLEEKLQVKGEAYALAEGYSTLDLEISVNEGAKKIDSFWLVRDTHAAYDVD